VRPKTKGNSQLYDSFRVIVSYRSCWSTLAVPQTDLSRQTGEKLQTGKGGRPLRGDFRRNGSDGQTGWLD